ncbi:MAG: polysaccharide deacetylase family protein [Oscillospiraceae bacterium]
MKKFFQTNPGDERMLKKTIYFLSAVITVCSLSLFCPAAGADSPETVELPIIMYHHINTSPKSWNEFTVSPDLLRGDLEYIKSKGYNTVTIKQLLSYSRGESELPPNPIMITFDDGNESVGVYAVPMLEELNMNAVLAIVGKYADNYTEVEDHNVKYSSLSWPDLNELQSSPAVEFAVHTYNMHSLTSRRGCKILPGEDVEKYKRILGEDLDKVEGRFIEYLGIRPEAFAYPYGFICDEAKEVLTGRGYSVLFTCTEKVNILTGDQQELLDLGRFNRPSQMSREQFFSKLGM